MLIDPQMAELLAMLVQPKPMTLFVPTSEAFQRMGDISSPALKEILKYYWVPNEAMVTSELLPSQMVMNANGQMLKVSKENGGWMVDGARVVMSDLRLQNGLVIWVIDHVSPKIIGDTTNKRTVFRNHVDTGARMQATPFSTLGDNQGSLCHLRPNDTNDVGAQSNVRPVWNAPQELVNGTCFSWVQ